MIEEAQELAASPFGGTLVLTIGDVCSSFANEIIIAKFPRPYHNSYRILLSLKIVV
jgi:hypothetical protein